MSDIKIPGVLWVILLVFGLTAVKEYVPEPFYVELAVVLVLAVLKAMNLGTKELDELGDIIDLLRKKTPPEQATPAALSASRHLKDEPEREAASYNRVVRWLAG